MRQMREKVKDKIRERLAALEGYVEILRRIKPTHQEVLVEDVATRSIAERHLQLAADICADIAQMIIAEQNLEKPEKAREAIDILGQEGVIDDEFAFEFAKVIGFRNILVHDYLKIDYEIVAEKINKNLDDFDIFARQVAEYVQKH